MAKRTEGHGLLRTWLKESGWQQAQLARACGRSEAAVSQWLSGSRPDGDARVSIERVTGIPFAAWSVYPKKKAA